MSKIVVSEFISLDGVMESPSWTMPYWNDEIARFKYDELFSVQALLLGRVTYQGFAAAWPGRTDEQGYADRMNGMPKFVVTATLAELAWTNSQPVRGNLPAALAALKQQPSQDLLVFGSGRLARTLLQLGLVDQFNLLVYPVVLGSGARLFQEGSQAKLTLVEARTFNSGVVGQVYRPAPAA